MATVHSVLYGWHSWKQLDNEACDDFRNGATDYFDYFDTVTDADAIAIYTCSIDGWAIRRVTFRNSGNFYKIVNNFCDNISGPS